MKRVLVVEDNQLNLELVTDLLEVAGYGVLPATTAEAGIELAGKEKPDLILMDIRLPRMDGFAAVAILKRDPATRRIPTVALTAQAMKGDEEAALVSGFDGYIAKPINTKTFVESIARYLDDVS